MVVTRRTVRSQHHCKKGSREWGATKDLGGKRTWAEYLLVVVCNTIGVHVATTQHIPNRTIWRMLEGIAQCR